MDFDSCTGVVWCIKIIASFCVNIYAEEFDNKDKRRTGLDVCATLTDRERREKSKSNDGSCFDKREADTM